MSSSHLKPLQLINEHNHQTKLRVHHTLFPRNICTGKHHCLISLNKHRFRTTGFGWTLQCFMPDDNRGLGEYKSPPPTLLRRVRDEYYYFLMSSVKLRQVIDKSVIGGRKYRNWVINGVFHDGTKRMQGIVFMRVWIIDTHIILCW